MAYCILNCFIIYRTVWLKLLVSAFGCLKTTGPLIVYGSKLIIFLCYYLLVDSWLVFFYCSLDSSFNCIYFILLFNLRYLLTWKISSTAAATFRQAVALIFDHVIGAETLPAGKLSSGGYISRTSLVSGDVSSSINLSEYVIFVNAYCSATFFSHQWLSFMFLAIALSDICKFSISPI